MKYNTEHYNRVQKWFDLTGMDQKKKLRGSNSQHGYLIYALYILEQMNAPKGAKVLEIGCGDGMVMNKIGGLRPDIDFFGIDISNKLVDEARLNNPSATFAVANAIEGIPFEIKFEIIISFSTIQYFPPDEVLNLNKVCANSISKNGRIIHCSIPDSRKKLVTQIDGFCYRFPSLLSMGLGFLKYLITPRNSFNKKDGSYWHNAENIKIKSEREIDNCIVNIKRPSDSWYRFDYSIEFEEES